MTQSEYDGIRDASTQALLRYRELRDNPRKAWVGDATELAVARIRFEEARAKADAAVIEWIKQTS